jgi:phenylalanyl-tRNA synthetase alpha chain
LNPKSSARSQPRGDEAALEAVRVAALGKKGSISALLATLGKMSPDERKTQGAAINLAKDKVTQALTARRDILKSAALDARLASETIDVTLPLREALAEAGRIHPLSQVFERSIRSSPTWDLRSPKVPISRPTTTTSQN